MTERESDVQVVRTEVNIRTLLRDNARSVAESDSALLRAYTSIRTAEHLKPARSYVVPNQWFIFSYYGAMTSYLRAVAPVRVIPDPQYIVPGGEVKLDASDCFVNVDDKREGLYVYLGTFVDASVPEAESIASAHDRLNEARGWVYAAFGDGLVNTLLFENTLDLRTLKQTVSLDVSIRSGVTREALRDYDEAHVNGLAAMLAAVDQLPANDQVVIRLAMRWYARALTESPTDAFLMTFLALEALAASLPGSPKVVRGINGLLSEGYELPLHEVQPRFLVGRLQGIRDRIAHGAQEHVTLEQVHYTQSVFLDSLAVRLGRPMTRGSSLYGDVQRRGLLNST